MPVPSSCFWMGQTDLDPVRYGNTDQHMEQQLFTLEQTGTILSYKKTKIREMIARGDLHTNGERGAGLRVTRQSILNYLARCEPCSDEKPRSDVPKAKATTGRIRRVATTIASHMQ